jgi:UDP-N-acetylglucosamine 1-carboxyvinyltransferase
MSEYLEIIGGVPLYGEVRISGAKNAILPMLCATLLTSEKCTFTNVPNIQDVAIACHLLERLGANFEHSTLGLVIEVPQLKATEASYSLVKALRASFWVLGPLLARGGAARVALPGGDLIGARPVDMHLSALAKMGADIKLSNGMVFAQAPKGLKPSHIELRFPSVGATHQILMAAALTPGVTSLVGAAREPEVVALSQMLVAMGAEIEGIGESNILIHGKEYLSGVTTAVIGDRLEAMTYMLAGLITGGKVKAKGINPSFLEMPLDILANMGAEISIGEDFIEIGANLSEPLKPTVITTGPYPQFATDLQPLFAPVLCLAHGVSTIDELVFEGRFGYMSELCRLGANLQIDRHRAYISGPSQFSGALVECYDIRAAASILIAGLAAQGTTIISEIQHLRRGYESLENKFQSLGACIRKRISDPEDFLFVGC